ncbi:MAG: beta-phosphoglucomutase [Spirochaetaceae bacterium 4572_59]|nr:MAG: beta-phosphoglucomutase [Spirochaetaceae bacterium 4572_59]
MSIDIKLVIFDLDGVLTDTAAFHSKAWAKLADDHGIPYSEEDDEKLKGIDRSAALEIILEKSRKKYTELEKREMCNIKNEHYKLLINDMSASDILPGSVETLEKLKRDGIKIALASASKNAETVVTKLGIKDYFDYIVDSREIKKGKPNPEIFLKAADELKMDIKHCIGVEDAIAGVKAIKSAGMKAIGIGDEKILSEADFVINSLENFNYAIEKLE